MRSINPATGEPAGEYPDMRWDDFERRIDVAYEVFAEWGRASYDTRAAVLRRMARLLRERGDEYAALMADEMGKPVTQGLAEVEKCAWACEYYADHAAAFLAPEPVATDATRSYYTFRPLGVVLAVMPWNFPFWQVFRFLAPALMAGNAALLKHASNVPGCALAIEALAHDAGCPEGLFSALLVRHDQVERIIRHPRVAAVTLTGSETAGRAVARVAGEALKKTVLELGGSDPYVVLADADLDHAVETCVASRLINAGQSCIAAKRFIVAASLHDAFVEGFVARMRAAKVGDPHDPATAVGPLARRDLREAVHDQVRRTMDAGAKRALGGRIPEGPGWWYPPTVLTDVRPGMPAFDEETFGPVAAIVRAESTDEALTLANDSRYGLGAAVFTADRTLGERIAAEDLQAGACFVNDAVRSDPRLPFGGIKRSGYGRELSAFGIRELVNIKTVWVR